MIEDKVMPDCTDKNGIQPLIDINYLKICSTNLVQDMSWTLRGIQSQRAQSQLIYLDLAGVGDEIQFLPKLWLEKL